MIDANNTTPEPREQAAAGLEKAATWLETHDWCQGFAAIGPSGPIGAVIDIGYATEEIVACCAAGAICLSVGPSGTYVVARNAVIQTLGMNPNMGWGNELAYWNDVPGRTKEEVCSALRKGADYLRSFS
jgi:hypothetical protein